MNKPRSFYNILSLGSLILGIGCVVFALVNIGFNSAKSNDVYASSDSTYIQVRPDPSFFLYSPPRILSGAEYSAESKARIEVRTEAARETEIARAAAHESQVALGVAEPTFAPGSMAAPMFRAANQPSESSLANTLPAAGKILYPEYPSEGDKIGTLFLPTLKREMPIYEGTGSKELKKGIGHYLQSVLPGESDNCVLSAHRDTLFNNLGKLKIGDKIYVQTSAGKFTYKISSTRIVEKDDRTVIVPKDHGVLTLTTCYPFSYIGNAPKRYIVNADLISE